MPCTASEHCADYLHSLGSVESLMGTSEMHRMYETRGPDSANGTKNMSYKGNYSSKNRRRATLSARIRELSSQGAAVAIIEQHCS